MELVVETVIVKQENQQNQKSHQEINDILDIYMIHEWTTGQCFLNPTEQKFGEH